MTPLMLAAREGNVECVHRLLRVAASPDTWDEDGWTALMHGIAANEVEVVRCLVLAAADVNNLSSRSEHSPLALAVFEKRTEMADLLLMARANLLAADRQGGYSLLMHLESGIENGQMLIRHGNRLHEALSLIHISEPTRLLSISYAVFCLKKKKKNKTSTKNNIHEKTTKNLDNSKQL
eukprot:TRINITY_DN12526_c0_g2_i1.p1 TRINITY_DN12526_c0_g2~~TRINITY_DN12526_c0_g2_i1.p1  ORF type:complete len:179 (-),score=53.00 TRINITY_DN12526_c0_g2_i1:10-546(-)